MNHILHVCFIFAILIFFYFLQNAKRIFNADCLSNSIQCVTYSLLYCIYFIRNCSFLIQDHRKNVSQILQLILFVPINFPSVAWGNVLLCFLAWYTFFKHFFFNLCWCFYIFWSLKKSLTLYIIRTVIEFYVDIFKIYILQNKSGNHSLPISSLSDESLFANGTEHEKPGSQFCKSHFTGFLGGYF